MELLSSERKTQDLTRYFQSLDTDSCELIAIDHPRRAIFAQPTTFIIVIPMTHLPVFFGRRFCITVDRGVPPAGKAQKFCRCLIVACASLWTLE